MAKIIDIRLKENEEALNRLSGRVLATLDQAELELLFAFYEQGRKVGVEVNFANENIGPSDICSQFRAVLKGDHAVPIWKDNSIITINIPNQHLKVVTMLLTRNVVLDCPYCRVEQGGFVVNPAGGTFECDECDECDDCEKSYKVHSEADIEHR